MKNIEEIKEEILRFSAIPEECFESNRLDIYAEMCLKYRISIEYFVDEFVFWFFGIKKERRF